MDSVPDFFPDHQALIARELERIIPETGTGSEPVRRAMRYTLLAPSKRVRAIVALLSAELCGSAERALAVASSIELVHASSLILDDLPSMDDASLRRGRPANHIQFGEAIAILAAFGLLNAAFAALSHAYEGPLARRITLLLTEAIGLDGLIGGQADDLLAADGPVQFEMLERIHRQKTGALFSAAATAGALTVNATSEQTIALAAYAKNLGLAFQIVDDLLEVEGDPTETGKAARLDLKRTTFVSFSGIAGARQLARELCETANAALGPFGRRADRLRQLAAFVADRSA